MATPDYVQLIADPPFEWGDEITDGTNSLRTYTLVDNKYNLTIAKAQEFLDLLIGEFGDAGYLGALNDIIEDYDSPTFEDFSVTIPTISFTPDNRPAPDLTGLDTDFPTFDVASPSFAALPTVDLTDLVPLDPPDEISAAISWTEDSHNTQLFTDLLARLLNDLQSGATGLDATVEAAIFSRGRARQAVEEDAVQTEIEEYFSSTNFDLPTGAGAARLQEHANGRTMKILDMNQKIIEDQGNLAQKNSQFVISVSKDLEAVLRDATNNENNRALDYAKAVAANAIAIYAEEVKSYIAQIEANKAYVEVQVENLKAVIESNKGLVALFDAEAQAYNTIVEAQAKSNEAIIDVYEAEVAGYSAETKAAVDMAQVTINEYGLRLQSADIELRTAIAEVEAALKGYEVESTLRERVAEAMANIANQAVASAYGAVTMHAGISDSSSRQQSESFGHTESRQVGYSHDNKLSETHLVTSSPQEGS